MRRALGLTTNLIGPTPELFLKPATKSKKNFVSLLVTALLGCFVLAISLMESSYRAVWHDEIFTESIARLERVDDVWSALARGTDLNSPLYYLAVRCADKLLGKTPLALSGFPGAGISALERLPLSLRRTMVSRALRMAGDALAADHASVLVRV